MPKLTITKISKFIADIFYISHHLSFLFQNLNTKLTCSYLDWVGSQFLAPTSNPINICYYSFYFMICIIKNLRKGTEKADEPKDNSQSFTSFI